VVEGCGTVVVRLLQVRIQEQSPVALDDSLLPIKFRVAINGRESFMSFLMPYKASGLGRENGAEAIEGIFSRKACGSTMDPAAVILS